MTQEAVPDETVPAKPAAGQTGAPKGLLQQMEELMAALNADLSQLDADLQPRDGRPAPAGTPAGAAAGASSGTPTGASAGTSVDAPVGMPIEVPVDASVDGRDAR
ncbi:hypothetical protein GO001_09700 [Streptomyces sp. NRRL B-1677]|uniref:hypothetical protein n=1 Tax=Streptomyces sp. NRRL B-1677 TaxID=2682966 RepID=UPI001892BD8C|nr:hypothetical protein [Streptomyces sp. NRRL B-1677]MBF6045492.1 hypothetical protein [Streptomyces sp. NRRL B-1677]